MKRRFLLQLFLESLPLIVAGQETNSGNGSIQGHVTDAQGLPIARALVALDDIMRVNSMETKTDEKGFYLLANVRPGRYSLRVEVAGVGCDIIPRLIVNYGEKIQKDFQFVRHGKVANCKAS
ncbi:MAG TPA: carboxypeptidase-like regulatory domain-containing protein [Bryobacteraceae bacterium]|jgi:hypothetical protein